MKTFVLKMPAFVIDEQTVRMAYYWEPRGYEHEKNPVLTITHKRSKPVAVTQSLRNGHVVFDTKGTMSVHLTTGAVPWTRIYRTYMLLTGQRKRNKREYSASGPAVTTARAKQLFRQLHIVSTDWSGLNEDLQS